jgi:hypothetical protein
MSRVIDLDAARAARAEANAEAPVVRFGGVDYTLPVELPWAMVEAAASGDAGGLVTAVKLLLGDQWETFESAQPSIGDLRILVEGVAELYGVDSGK